MTRAGWVRQLFDDSAARLEQAAAPVIQPLVDDFAGQVLALSLPANADRPRLLDLGTGSGSLARHLAATMRHTVAIDLSGRSLALARQRDPAIGWVQGDFTRAPLASGAFDLLTASFALNTTDPARSIPALRRLLGARGRLAIQEWGAASPAYQIVEETLADFATSEPGERLGALRALLVDDPPRWAAQVQDTDDLADWLLDAGFAVDSAAETAPVTVRVAVSAFVRFMLADAVRHAEVAALAPAQRAAFQAALRARLAGIAAEDGHLRWQPALIRAFAHVPRRPGARDRPVAAD